MNGLWLAGAEAVDINGQRLTSLSAIRGSRRRRARELPPLGAALRRDRDRRPGDARGSVQRRTGGGELETLRQTYGVRYELESRDGVTVPAEPGLMLRYAQEALP